MIKLIINTINNKFNLNVQEHPYFLVTPSIIPTLTSISALFFVTEIVNFFYFLSKPYVLILSFLTLSFILFEWFFNVALESDYHTKAVQYNNKIAFMLFISTEIMFFFIYINRFNKFRYKIFYNKPYYIFFWLKK